jgi:DNA polymerase
MGRRVPKRTGRVSLPGAASDASGAGALIAPGASLDELRAAAARCCACALWERGTQTVCGEGPADARAVLVGEQPGDVEDRLGHPFIGPAGRLLDGAG